MHKAPKHGVSFVITKANVLKKNVFRLWFYIRPSAYGRDDKVFLKIGL